jgi:hypothetical protein
MLRVAIGRTRPELVTPHVAWPFDRAGRTVTTSPYWKNRPRWYRGRFDLFAKWTRTQRIRTAASIPVEAVIAEGGELPVYLKIADNAKHLRELGMSDRAIARSLGVSDKTIAKAAGAAGLSPR